jgi:2-polyprenyl-3-methyl-5-hydroxy-6-metoxy-1,4-benzoquinol methylase
MGPAGAWIKRMFSRAASAASRQHVFVLSADAGPSPQILDARGAYRVSGDDLRVELREPSRGTLEASLLGYIGHHPRRVIWKSPPHSYDGPTSVILRLSTGEVAVNATAWGRIEPSAIGPRFCWRFSHTTNGRTRSRLTSHYRADRDGADDHGEAYYSGANYVDYDAESRAQHRQVLELLDEWRAQGPLLEVGCATGGLLQAIERERGIAGLGVDISGWAVAQAARKLGPNRAWQADLDRDPLPAAIRQAAPFRTIVMFSVLEHLQNPQAVIAALTSVSSRGTLLLLETTNSESLCHRVFGDDWEGYFDRTHLAVDRVGVRAVSQWLSALGWTIADRRTRMIWDGSADPTHATFRDWWDSDARFRQMLHERDLGDLVFFAAVKA